MQHVRCSILVQHIDHLDIHSIDCLSDYQSFPLPKNLRIWSFCPIRDKLCIGG